MDARPNVQALEQVVVMLENWKKRERYTGYMPAGNAYMDLLVACYALCKTYITLS